MAPNETNGKIEYSSKSMKFVGGLSLLAALSVLVFVLFAAVLVPTLIRRYYSSLSVGVALGLLSTIIMVKIDQLQGLNKIKVVGIRIKWIIITLISCGIIFIGFVVYLYHIGQSLTSIDVGYIGDDVLTVLFYLIGSIISAILGWLFYLGVKNWKMRDVGKGIIQKARTRKFKQSVLGIVSIFFILVGPFGSYYFMQYGVFGRVEDKYAWNDGPWLTWENNPSDTVVISWLTDKEQPSKMIYGIDPTLTSNNQEVNIENKTFIHHVELVDLIPNTTYYYSIGVNFQNFAGNTIFNFTTAPTGKTSNFRFCIVGDMQPTDERTQAGGELVAKGIAAQNPNFVVQLGDVCSSGGSVSLWHRSLTNIPFFASTAPIQSIVGNHDYSGDSSHNYHEIFPYNYEDPVANYYSFNFASAHFVMIDNFVGPDSTLTEKQQEWIISDIEQAKANGQKWVFINFHHTILTTGTSGQNWALQKWLVPVADKYDIDGVFFGHDHHYEHWNYTYGSSGLLYNDGDSPSGNGTQYFCSGGGGAHLEVDYGLLTHDPYTNTREFYNISAGQYQSITVIRNHWNPELYVNEPENEIYAESKEDHLYYQAPGIESYSTDNDIFGYDYGEEALHFILVEISNNGNTCTISTRYPNGELLAGPGGAYPQEFTFNK